MKTRISVKFQKLRKTSENFIKHHENPQKFKFQFTIFRPKENSLIFHEKKMLILIKQMLKFSNQKFNVFRSIDHCKLNYKVIFLNCLLFSKVGRCVGGVRLAQWNFCIANL